MRSLVVIAAMALAAPLAAQALEPTDTTGALSGRSPHKVMRVAAQTPACGKTMHSIPAGKLPHYGRHALPAACDTVNVAIADSAKKVAARAE